MHETIKEIKSKLRLYMNDIISQSMRDKGMDYKLNFGIEYPRIKEIAAEYEPNHELAQALWKENIRECKIMAGLLQPTESFYPEIAEIWIEDMHYPELAEYTVMNLFQRLPYAPDIVFRWMADDREYFQLCGFLLMARLLMKGMKLDEQTEDEFIDQTFTALESESLQIRKAAATALRKFGNRSRNDWKKISKQLSILCKSEKPDISTLANETKNDIEYCLQSF